MSDIPPISPADLRFLGWLLLLGFLLLCLFWRGQGPIAWSLQFTKLRSMKMIYKALAKTIRDPLINHNT